MDKRSRIYMIVFFTCVLLAGISNAAVVINEVELNPAGEDSGNEWIEILNDGSPVNLSGWYIEDEAGHIFEFPSEFADRFYVLNNLSDLNNLNEALRLYDNTGAVRDVFEDFDDGDGDGFTWSRVPDATGNFVFQEGTMGMPNQGALIENKDSNPECIIRGDIVTLSAEVTGFCIEKTIFSVLENGVWKNYTGDKNGNVYSAIVNTSQFDGNINWKASAVDCFNFTYHDGSENFHVNGFTELEIIPGFPDGLNGWYVNAPLFKLVNEDAEDQGEDLFYQWDSQEDIEYEGIFGLENTPNNASVSGGILELNYWSGLCDGNEQHQREIIKTDFSNPVIKNLNPDNGEIIIDETPRISAFLDEIYQSNSGINRTRVFMRLDGILVNAAVKSVNALDAEVSYIVPNGLNDGVHIVRVDVEDLAGRASSLLWSFNVSSDAGAVFSVFSPLDGIYNDKRVVFNISSSEEMEIIEYINYNELNPRWRSLCSDCEEYGFLKKRTRTMLEGENNITIRGVDSFGRINKASRVFMIESRDPRILKAEPRKGFTSGKFMIEFEEENPEEVELNYGNDITGFRAADFNLGECEYDRDEVVCEEQINLMDYENEAIDYYFLVRDISNNTAVTKSRILFVDTIDPFINEFGYSIDGKRVKFEIEIDELNFYRVSYIDYSETTPRLRTMCTRLDEEGRCIKKINFPVGEHNLTVQAADKAGNKQEIEGIIFSV